MTNTISNPSATIGTRTVVSSGSFVVPNNQPVEFFPIGIVPDFKFVFYVNFDDSLEDVKTKYEKVEGGIGITIFKKWDPPNRSSLTRPTRLLVIDDEEYFLYYTFETYGSRDVHGFLFSYTLVKDAKA